ncbi:MAG: beta galactosidase jelly roll domain-containing protein, partial [Bacteroidales bacterium]
MNHKTRLTLILYLIISLTAKGQVSLPKLISDGMVLQRDADIKIWGWAAAGEQITVSFNDSVYEAIADDTGEWEAILSSLKAGGPFTMIVSGSNTITINDILVGDVWVCSGQSNMELSMKRASPLYETEIANSENQCIRYFEVPKKYYFNAPKKDIIGGKWISAGPDNILKFSAVSYFFAHELYKKTKTPVGLINSSLGGSPAEAWMSEDALKAFPEHYNEAQQFKDTSLIRKIKASDKIRFNTWYSKLGKSDAGYKDTDNPWRSPDLNTSDWPIMKVPGYWSDEEIGNVNGVVWFRKKIQVPASMTGKPAKLLLGRIVDADSVFINGIFVGSTSYQYPPRRYDVPSDLLKEGENTIAVRVISNIGKGGFVSDKPYMLVAGEQKIDLKGDWQYKLGAKMEPLQSQTFIRWKPAGLYNAMISPLINYSIKGVIWYQGESNAGRPEEYVSLFPALINNWREKWKQGSFPFLYVQLPNFMKPSEHPSESNWALTREAQLKALSLPNTGMAVAIDIGEWNDIHPLNKKDVGCRLALAAQKVAYNDNKVVYSGPIYHSMEKKGNKIILTFSNTGSGLEVKGGGELKYFSIAGTDKKFIWATAKIENKKVIVWNDKIQNPVAVRYAWAD